MIRAVAIRVTVIMLAACCLMESIKPAILLKMAVRSKRLAARLQRPESFHQDADLAEELYDDAATVDGGLTILFTDVFLQARQLEGANGAAGEVDVAYHCFNLGVIDGCCRRRH